MRSSGSLFLLLLVLAITACGGPSFTKDSTALATEAGANTIGEAGASSSSAGMPASGGTSGHQGVAGSTSGQGGTGLGGSAGQSAAGTGGIAGNSNGGSDSGLGGSGLSLGGSNSSAGQDGMKTGGTGGTGGTATIGPYDQCQRDYVTAACSSSPDGLAFKYQCSVGADPTNCVYDASHVPTCDCTAVPDVPGAFCCRQNSLGCIVVASVGPSGKCGSITGPAPDFKARPYLYNQCSVPGNPVPSECTAVGNGQYCCSSPYSK